MKKKANEFLKKQKRGGKRVSIGRARRTVVTKTGGCEKRR